MATITHSGNIPTPSNGFNLKVEVTYTQDVSTNKTTITAVKGYVKRNDSSYYPHNSTSSAVFTIKETSGTQLYSVTKTPSYNLSSDGYKEVLSVTPNKAISHNADGTKSIVIAFSFDGKLSSYYPVGSISKTVTLPTIPRASTPTLSASSIAMGSSLTITTNRASTSFTHTLTYSFGSASGTIASSVGASTTWTPPIDLANQIPSATSGKCTITCKTYNGSTLIGTKTVTVELKVPDSVVPSISSIALSEAGSTPSSWGCYVQNKSKLKVVTTASGSYSSTIKSYKITGIDSTTYSSSSFTSNILTSSGTKTITATVTDSRGRTATKTTTYTCVAYSNPSISNTSVTRCNSDGTDNEEGTYVKYTFKASVSSVNSKNGYEFKIGYKKSSDSSYTYVTIANDGYSLDKSNVVLSDVTFSENSSYDFQFKVNDYFTSTTATQALGTGFTLMDFNSSGKGMAIGKASEKDVFEVALDTVITGKLLDTLKSADTFNRGSWNKPTKGLITQITDNSGAQHSVIVGLKSDETTRLYGIDLLDSDSNPIMALYAGTNYLQLGDGYISTDGLLKSTNYGNTVSIGSQNSSCCHIYNSADIPFYFNKKILINGANVVAPVTAYSNSSGTSGTVTLSYNVSDYTHIRITYKNSDSQYGATEHGGISNATGTFYGTIIRQTTSGGTLLINSALFTVSGKTITISRNQQTNITSSSVVLNDANYLYITKVELWN